MKDKIYSRINKQLLEKMKNIYRRAKIYKLIDEKINILNEHTNLKNLDNEPADDDNEASFYKINNIMANNNPVNLLSKDELEKLLEALNKELEYSTEDDIDWNKYPKFYIAQYRGLHYYRNLFSRKQRLDHCNTWHLNRTAAAPAVYHMSSLTPKQHQLARESIIDREKKTIIRVFNQLESSSPTRQYYGDKTRTFENASDMLQERMSNAYDNYKKDVENPTNSHTQLLYDNKIIGYPHYATSDLPFHALKYAYGQKAIASLKKWRLSPMFRKDGSRAYPYPGKIFISMYTPLEMHKYRTRHVAGKHKREQIKLSRYVLPERETSIPGGIEAESAFYEELLRIPSFEDYTPYSCEEYGINLKKFEKFKTAIANAYALEEQDEDEEKYNALDKINVDIIEKTLIPYKEKKLLEIAQNEARQRGGYLIYRHSSGKYGLRPEALPLPGKENNKSLYKREEELLLAVEGKRFDIFNNEALPQTPQNKNSKKRDRDVDVNSDSSSTPIATKKQICSSFFNNMSDDESSYLVPKPPLLEDDTILAPRMLSFDDYVINDISLDFAGKPLAKLYQASNSYNNRSVLKSLNIAGIDEPYYEVPVASDGSCLFYSVAFAFLLPAVKNEQLFKERFVLLFGNEDINVQDFINDGGNKIIQNPEILQNLVNLKLRTRVVDYMM